MKNYTSISHEGEPLEYEITEKGSLGLLALGDVGLRAWRKVKQRFHKKGSE